MTENESIFQVPTLFYKYNKLIDEKLQVEKRGQQEFCDIEITTTISQISIPQFIHLKLNDKICVFIHYVSSFCPDFFPDLRKDITRSSFLVRTNDIQNCGKILDIYKQKLDLFDPAIYDMAKKICKHKELIYDDSPDPTRFTVNHLLWHGQTTDDDIEYSMGKHNRLNEILTQYIGSDVSMLIHEYVGFV